MIINTGSASVADLKTSDISSFEVCKAAADRPTQAELEPVYQRLTRGQAANLYMLSLGAAVELGKVEQVSVFRVTPVEPPADPAVAAALERDTQTDAEKRAKSGPGGGGR
jgi:hypothetical protein